jgi:hypothetical protein
MLNGYRVAKGKQPFPVGPAAETIDWNQWASNNGSSPKVRTGTYFGTPWEVLDGYFAIPSTNRFARLDYIRMHPELTASFEAARLAKEEKGRLADEALKVQYPEIAARQQELIKDKEARPIATEPKVVEGELPGTKPARKVKAKKRV